MLSSLFTALFMLPSSFIALFVFSSSFIALLILPSSFIALFILSSSFIILFYVLQVHLSLYLHLLRTYEYLCCDYPFPMCFSMAISSGFGGLCKPSMRP